LGRVSYREIDSNLTNFIEFLKGIKASKIITDFAINPRKNRTSSIFEAIFETLKPTIGSRIRNIK
jgi:hypothetical protein